MTGSVAPTPLAWRGKRRARAGGAAAAARAPGAARFPRRYGGRGSTAKPSAVPLGSCPFNNVHQIERASAPPPQPRSSPIKSKLEPATRARLRGNAAARGGTGTRASQRARGGRAHAGWVWAPWRHVALSEIAIAKGAWGCIELCVGVRGVHGTMQGAQAGGHRTAWGTRTVRACVYSLLSSRPSTQSPTLTSSSGPTFGDTFTCGGAIEAQLDVGLASRRRRERAHDMRYGHTPSLALRSSAPCWSRAPPDLPWRPDLPGWQDDGRSDSRCSACARMRPAGAHM